VRVSGPEKQKRGNHQSEVLEEGNFWVQFDEIAKTAAVLNTHLFLQIGAPFGKIKEVGVGWYVTGEVGETRQNGENNHQQEEEPCCKFFSPTNNQCHPQHNFQYNHGYRKGDGMLSEPRKYRCQSLEHIIQAIESYFKSGEVILHLVGCSDRIHGFDKP